MTDEKKIQQDYKTKCFDNAIDNYLQHIESLWTSLPIVMKTIENTHRNSKNVHNDFLLNNCEYIDEKKHYLVPPEHYRRNRTLTRTIENSRTAIKIIKRNFLVSLISQFDTYIADLIKSVFEVRPEIINNSEKQLTFAELSKFDTLAEAKDFIIEKEIETILRENYLEQFKWFEKKLNIQLRKDLPIWPTFIEISQRRNLFVHNNGKVSSHYLSVCRENKVHLDDSIVVGSELDVSINYFEKAFKSLFEIGVKLNQVIRRNICPEELEKADVSFLYISFELIQNNQLDLAKTLYDFSDKYIKKYSNTDLKLRILLNRAQKYKWLGNDQECKKIVTSEDWSASGELFKLASKILLDDFDAAAQIMEDIGNNEKIINKATYKDWPIFKRFRKTEAFRHAYNKIYEEEFEVVEEKKMTASTTL